MDNVEVCMFDQYGTLVDMQGGLIDVAKPYLAGKGSAISANSFVTWWRRTHFENSMIDALLHRAHMPYREIGHLPHAEQVAARVLRSDETEPIEWHRHVGFAEPERHDGDAVVGDFVLRIEDYAIAVGFAHVAGASAESEHRCGKPGADRLLDQVFMTRSQHD